MKGLLLITVIGAFVALASSSAFAADSSAYLAQCKANVESEQGPPNMTKEQRLAFCQCFAEQATDNQAVLDEGTAMSKMPVQERMSKFPSASDGFKAAIEACAKKLGLQPPPQPPAQGN